MFAGLSVQRSMRRSLPRWSDHKTTAALFEKESSGDNDANLKGFASKTADTEPASQDSAGDALVGVEA